MNYDVENIDAIEHALIERGLLVSRAHCDETVHKTDLQMATMGSTLRTICKLLWVIATATVTGLVGALLNLILK